MILAAALLPLANVALAAVGFDARVKDGLTALQRGEADRAELALRKAVTQNPDDADAHVALAVALFENHERPEAVAEYAKALALERRYVEGLRFTAAARKRGWIRRPPETWDMEQQDMSIEAFNAPEAHQKAAFKANIHFPAGWVVEGASARPDIIGSHASIVTSGGQDGFNAQDAADWFEKARRAASARYRGYQELELHGFARGGATGVKVLYTRRDRRFKEALEDLDVVLLKNGQYRRATYEAPKSEFERHFEVVQSSLDTLQF